MMNPDIFREYDIRGVYNKDFDDAFACKLGYCYVNFLKKNLNKDEIRLSVGYDARLSSPALTQALCDGVQKAGGFVYMLDLVPSPLSYYSCFNLDIDGSIMITGSHNPPDHNGFKISKQKTTIHSGEINELKELIFSTQEDLSALPASGSMTSYNIIDDYVKKYTEEFKGKIKNTSVCFDCANATAGVILTKLFDTLNLKGEILFAQPDGSFPNHHPDPSLETNMEDLKKCVLKSNYDLGIGFDGDSDRIGVVDNLGRMISVDQFMLLYAQDILEDRPGATIIGDVKCSQVYYDKINEFGGNAIMWKTGHSLIKEKVKHEKAPFGGELSGHVFFADRNYGYDDAVYAGLRLLEILDKKNIKLSDFIDSLPQTFSTPELRIEVKESEKFRLVESLKKDLMSKNQISKFKILEVNDLDGVRVKLDCGWALVRASNTQPAITLRFECIDSVSLREIKKSFSELLGIPLA